MATSCGNSQALSPFWSSRK